MIIPVTSGAGEVSGVVVSPVFFPPQAQSEMINIRAIERDKI